MVEKTKEEIKDIIDSINSIRLLIGIKNVILSVKGVEKERRR